MSAELHPNARCEGAEPRLSVLIPFHRDDPRPLLAALAMQAQALPPGAVEVVVLDDAGGDPALSAVVHGAVAALPVPAMLIALAANEGRAKGRNRLAATARARHLLFIDSDMLPDSPGFLAAWLELAGADPAAAFGGFSLIQAAPGPEHRLHHALQLGAECLSAARRAESPAKHVFTSNLLIRRDVLATEPFDEAFAGWGWEDVEWGARVAERFGVTHIDNTASHLGLDTAPALAAKYEQSAPNFARLLSRHPALVRGFPSFRAARLIRRLPARTPLRGALKALAMSELAPLRARTAAMRLYKAALYSEVVR